MKKFEDAVKVMAANAITQQDLLRELGMAPYQSHKLNLLLKDYSHRLLGRIVYDRNDIPEIKKVLDLK